MSFTLSQSKQDLLENLLHKAKKPKIALKEVERWIVKHPKDEQLTYLKSDILLRCGRIDEALTLAENIVKTAPPMKSISLLRNLHEFFFRVQQIKGEKMTSAGMLIINMWRAALRVQLDVSECLREWYAVAVRCKHWEDAQMAIVAMRKELPNDSTMLYHYIAVSNMVAEAIAPSDATRAKVHRMLAWKFLRSIVDQTIANSSGAKTTISKPQDMALVLEIYTLQGEHQSLLSILDSKEVGIISKQNFDKGAMILEKLNILERLEEWSELASFCQYLIKNAQTALGMEFDWTVFKALRLSMKHLSPSAASDIVDFLRDYLGHLPEKDIKGRNHLLACISMPELKGPSGQVDPFSNAEIQDLRLTACVSYFKHFGSSPCFLDDLRPYVAAMEPDRRLELLHRLGLSLKAELGDSQATNLTAAELSLRLSVLKVEYLIRNSLGHARDTLIEFLSEFVLKCFRTVTVFESSKPSACRESNSLLVAALMKLHLIKVDRSDGDHLAPALQALAVLEYHIGESPEDREARLMHVCLSRYLGLTSKALSSFPQLKIRGILVEGFSHILCNRLATSYPLTTGTSNIQHAAMQNEDAVSEMEAILLTYNTTVNEITSTMADLTGGPIYHILTQSAALLHGFEHSLSRRLVCIEKRRALRLRGVEVDDQCLQDMVPFLTDLSDERKYTSIPAFEADAKECMQKSLSAGPMPNLGWLATAMLWDDTQNLIEQAQSFHPDDIRRAESIIASSGESSELTVIERQLTPAWQDLRLLVLHLGKPPVKDHPHTSVLIEKVNASIVKLPKVDSDRQPWSVLHWVIVHELLAQLEYLRACKKM
ncbi:N-acetyltransferase B complex non catalytic subunit [Fusarium oxysporum f. sp. phaseoli]